MAYTNINKSTDYFNTKLYTGNGSTQSITGVGFQPDWTWIKQRNGTGWHNVYDAVRGSTKRLQTNDTGAESTITNSITSFDSDGFSLGSNGDTNGSSNTTVSWNWLANGTGSANTDGSVNSTVSVNTTAGFSIVSYTGNGNATDTIGHGLGAVPKMIIVKKLSGVSTWNVYHQAIGNTGALYLNTNDGTTTSSGFWNNTSPTSSVFTYNTTNPHIAYCFAEKTGYSKFGSYTGNGNADGTFVYTGFKPAFVMIKYSNATESWYMYDNKRQSYNAQGARLRADANEAEASSANFDFLSNGIKIRTSGSAANTSGGSYIYMAFASAPLVGTNNIPATAR